MLTALYSIYNQKTHNYLEHSSLQYGSSLASLTLPLHNTIKRTKLQYIHITITGMQKQKTQWESDQIIIFSVVLIEAICSTKMKLKFKSGKCHITV